MRGFEYPTSVWSPETYKAAIDFAAQAHGEQKVPGSGHPYLSHLAKVAMEVIAANAADTTFDGDLAIACALLHDSMEDAGVTRAQVEQYFGPKVAAGVAALTKNASLPKGEQMADSLARIRAQPREVWIVKLADRITNLEPPPHYWTPEKRKKYREEAREIRERLRGACKVLEDRIEQKIEQYEKYC